MERIRTMLQLGCMVPVVAFVALASASARAEPDPAEHTQWSVAEVVVHTPTPRIWKLSSGESTVYVVGSVAALPKGLTWNKARMAVLMGAAHRLILPPRGTLGVFGAAQVLPFVNQRNGAILDAELSADQRTRLQAVLTRLGVNPARYQHFKAAWAALQLEQDLRQHGPVSDEEPIRTLKQLAKARGVDVVEAGNYNATNIMKELIRLPETDGVNLLDRATIAAAFQLEHAPAMGRAWAVGDLRGVADNEARDIGLIELLNATSAAQALRQQAETDMMSAIASALKLPGSSIAIVNLAEFARKGGAIDRLRSEGVQIVEAGG